MRTRTEEELYQIAEKRVAARKAFKMHLSVFIAVNLFLMVISLSQGESWFIYPLLGWGIGLAFHGMSIKQNRNQEKEVAEEVERLKREM